MTEQLDYRNATEAQVALGLRRMGVSPRRNVPVDPNTPLPVVPPPPPPAPTPSPHESREALLKLAVTDAAEAAGSVDADAVFALLDREGVEVGDDGTVTGATEAVAKLLEAKPYLRIPGSDGRPLGSIDQGQQGPPQVTPTQSRLRDSAVGQLLSAHGLRDLL